MTRRRKRVPVIRTGEAFNAFLGFGLNKRYWTKSVGTRNVTRKKRK